jgi:hypothetical protein
MIPVQPAVPHEGAEFVIFAKDQPQYTPLPASVSPDGLVMTEWTLTDDEIARVVCGARIRLWIRVYPHQCKQCGTTEPAKLQPVSLQAAALEELPCPMDS